MPPFALPKSSRVAVAFGAVALAAGFVVLTYLNGFRFYLLLPAFFISAYLSDLFTGVAHFCFDYVFPYKTPVLGPISKEFTNHHEYPALAPENVIENLTKGAYACILISLLWMPLAPVFDGSLILAFIASVIWGCTFWALFFHQIHSYAHMGNDVSAEVFTSRAREIANLSSKEAQIREFEKLFASAPIPKWIRFLQKTRILLTPERHNIHHLHFESDFSSVNGWSDPLLNIIATPIAKYYKSKRDRQR